MKNKFLFLLSLFSLSSVTTQCMEKETVVPPKTMQEIRDERTFIYQKRLNFDAIATYPLDSILFQEHWSNNISLFKKEPHNTSSILPNYTWHKDFTEHGYSLIGITTIAIKSGSNRFEGTSTEGTRKKELLNKKDPIQVSFKEKKEHIRQFLTLGFIPNKKDTYFALLAKYEQYASLIIKNHLNLQHAPLVSEINIPEDIIRYISLLMFDTEESLF